MQTAMFRYAILFYNTGNQSSNNRLIYYVLTCTCRNYKLFSFNLILLAVEFIGG